MNTVTPEELLKARCQACGDKDPDCEGLVLAARCHPKAGARVAYRKAEHLLRVSCAECNRHIIDIAFGAPDGKPTN